MFGHRQDERRVQAVDFHPRAVRGDKAALATREIGNIGQDADKPGGRVCPLLDAQAKAVTRKHRHFGVVGGIDHVQPETQPLRPEGQVVAQFGRG